MNSFKRNLKNVIVAFLLLAIVFYVTISFIEKSFNPFDWHIISRLIYAIGALISLWNLKNEL